MSSKLLLTVHSNPFARFKEMALPNGAICIFRYSPNFFKGRPGLALNLGLDGSATEWYCVKGQLLNDSRSTFHITDSDRYAKSTVDRIAKKSSLFRNYLQNLQGPRYDELKRRLAELN